MNCNCKRKPRFVRGNAFSLNVEVKAKRPDGTSVSDFVLDDTATLLLMTSNGVATVLTYTVGEDNNAIVAFDGNLPVGIYGLDFQGSQDGTEWRFSDTNIFQVVEHTPQGHVPSDGVVYADDTLEVDAEITLSTLSSQADWTETDPGAQSYIRNKPDLSTYATDAELTAGLATKQDTLVSGTNIKTVNGSSIVGSGNLEIQAGLDPMVINELSTINQDAVTEQIANGGNVVLKQNDGFYIPLTEYDYNAAGKIDYMRFDSSSYDDTFGEIDRYDVLWNINSGWSVQEYAVPTNDKLSSELATKQDTLTFDSTPTANSTNPVTSGGIKAYVDNHSASVTVDDALSTSSENPVQNKVITTALNGKQDTISDLSTIRSGASAGATAVQPATMNTALAAKQDTISTVNVTVDNNTGTPSGSASVSGGTLSLSLQNLKGATGAQGPQGIQGVQGVQGPKGDTGVSGDASSLAIIHGIDKTSSYATTDVCGADAAQALLNAIEGGFYY